MPFGTPRTFHKKFKFLVEIDGFIVAKFRKCSALEAEIAVIEQSEGGALTPNKSPGRAKFSDITLERGATDNLEMYTWFRQGIDAAANTGLKESELKRNFDIIQLDRDDEELRRWPCTGGFPSKFSGGEWDNEVDENVIESVTIAYDFFGDPV